MKKIPDLLELKQFGLRYTIKVVSSTMDDLDT
jgi:hypothetical protein